MELVLVARRSLASYVRNILPIEKNSIYEIILVKVNWCDLSIFFNDFAPNLSELDL